jgi:uncharacterized protein (TIGR03437 family)
MLVASPLAISLLVSLMAGQNCVAQSLVLSQTNLTFTGVGNSTTPPAPQTVQLTSSTGVSISFGVQQALDNVTISPEMGTTPATITVSPATSVPGTFQTKAYFIVEGTSASSPSYATLNITLTYSLPPPPAVNSIVNAASLQSGPLSPGEIVSIFGANLAGLSDQTQLDSPFLGSGWFYFPTISAGTSVLFNGTYAPVLYAAGGQVNAIVPVGLAGQSVADVIVVEYGVASSGFSVPLQDTTPAIFSISHQGSGPGAIFNATNNLVNSANNPAPKGSIIQIYAEGGGVWNQPGTSKVKLQDGQIDNLGSPYPSPVEPVSLTIGGQPAQILYAGQAPDLVAGALQINAVVPANIGSGPQPVVLTIGSYSNSSQPITVAVQ